MAFVTSRTINILVPWNPVVPRILYRFTGMVPVLTNPLRGKEHGLFEVGDWEGESSLH